MKRIAFLAIALLGCASARDTVVQTANVSAVTGDAAHATLAVAYEAEQRSCLPLREPRPCIERVRADYAAAWLAYIAYRDTWIALSRGVAAVDAGASPATLVPLAAALIQAEQSMRDALPKETP